MFNKDFYPTPPEIIEYMINGDDLSGKQILEPSAGSGAILKTLHKHGAITTACEIHPDLQSITKAHCDTFLKDDFLKVERDEISHIDMIIMNPPFSKDVDHIVHAWEVAPDGCNIVALCNWETLNNRYTMRRSELGKIIEDYGLSENLGECFTNAERKTNVEVGLVRLFKPAAENCFDDFFDMGEDEPEKQSNGLMPYNEIREVVQRYVAALKLYDHVADTAIQMNDLITPLGAKSISMVISQNQKEQTVNKFRIDLQISAWKWIFNKLNMEKFMTEKLKADLNTFINKQTKIPFTMKNIYKMLDMIVQTHGQRMQTALIDVFDKITKHHHQNRYDVEGWKTNQHYLVGKKFIFNYVRSYSGWNSHPEIDYRFKTMDDMQKALNYITGQKHSQTLSDFFKPKYDREKREYYDVKDWGKWYEWGYFRVKVFKKGTGHFQFLDEKVWEMFNKEVARAKGYPLYEKL